MSMETGGGSRTTMVRNVARFGFAAAAMVAPNLTGVARQDLCALDGVETFRMRFVLGAAGQAVRIVALYFDGSRIDRRR